LGQYPINNNQIDWSEPDTYRFEVFARKSVPQAIISFLEANGFEDAIRNAISLGGDADTQACIAGSIAEAFYGIPDEIRIETKRRLDAFLLLTVIKFCDKYITPIQS